jgi:hypothetical protein
MDGSAALQPFGQEAPQMETTGERQGLAVARGRVASLLPGWRVYAEGFDRSLVAVPPGGDASGVRVVAFSWRDLLDRVRALAPLLGLELPQHEGGTVRGVILPILDGRVSPLPTLCFSCGTERHWEHLGEGLFVCGACGKHFVPWS